MKIKTKKKKYFNAGLVAPTLAPKLSNELAPGPKAIDPKSATDPMNLVSGIADVGTSLFSGLADRTMNDTDFRDNPAIAMKKANGLNTAGDLLGAAGKGAALGAIGGPVGMAVGAGIGLLTTGIGKILGAKQQRKDLANAQTGWASDNLSSYQDAMSKTSYVKGGVIKGKGTGKSDSINMSAKDGSFIVPSENADYGRQIGEEYLGWKPGEKADKKSGGVDIKASNSEVIYTPEEVRVLKYHGVNLDALAPNANAGASKGSGGGIHINPANKGKLTATKKKTGKSTAKLTHSSNLVTKKRAIFAQNAKKWHHAKGGVVTDSNTTPISKIDDNGKQIVYRPGTDEQYDKGLVINPGWDRVMGKGASIDEVNNSVIGTWNDKPLTAGMFQQFPQRVRNTWNFDFMTEKQKMRLNLPNKAQEMNMKESSKDVYLRSQDLKAAGNTVAYVGPIKRATGGPVANPVKDKPSMTGALVNYMNNPKDTGAKISRSDPNNKPVTDKQRFVAANKAFSNDPEKMGKVLAMGSMAGGITDGGGIYNKLQAIEEIVNSPRYARIGKAMQDMIREEAPKLSSEEFASRAGDAGLKSLGKYWTYGDLAKNSGYKKGGKVMKKKNMIKDLSTGMKGKKKKVIPGDIEIPGMKKGGYTPGGKVTETPVREALLPEATVFKPKISNFKMQSKPGSTLGNNKPTFPKNEFPDIGIAELAGIIQAAGGAYGLATAKRAPDLGVSETLQKLSADVHKQASYGLDPAQMNALNNSVERSRRDTNRLITEGGGSGQEVMAKLNTTLNSTIAGKEDIAFKDSAEKARKFSNVIGVDTAMANEEFDVKRMKREDWYKSQDMFAGLLSTGLENIIGARQFKQQQKTLSEIDNRAVIKF